MGAENVIRILRKHISSEQLPFIVSALRHDPFIWDSLGDPILMGKMLNYSTGERKFWSPASLAVLSVTDTAPEQFNLYSVESWSPVLLQNVTSALTHAQDGKYQISNISQAAFLALGLKNKYRENLSWKETFSFISKSSSEPGSEPVFKLNSVIEILFGLITDPQQFIHFVASGLPNGHALAIQAVLAQPLNEDEQMDFFKTLLGKMPLDESVLHLGLLEKAGCENLTNKLAKYMIESSGINENSSLNDGTSVKQLNLLSQLYQLAGEPKKAVQILNRAKSLLNEMTKTLSKSKGRIALYKLENSEFHTEMGAEIDGMEADERFAAATAALIDHKQLSDDELNELEPEIKILYAAESEKEPARKNNIILSAVDQIIDSGDFAANLVDPSKILKALNSANVEDSAARMEDFFLKIFCDDRNLVKVIRDNKINKGEIQNSEEIAQLIAAIDPDDCENRRILGNLYIQSNEWEDAYTEFHFINNIAQKPTVKDQIALAEIALHTGRLKESWQIAEKIIAADENQCKALICAGRASLELGEANSAAKYFKKAADLEPESNESWEGLAEYYQKIGDEEKESETLKKGLQFSPDSGSMNYRMSQILLNQGRFTETVPYLEKAVKLIPGSPDIAVDLARSLRSTGRMEEAANVVKKACEKWNSDPALAFEQGEINSFNKNYRVAMANYENALNSLNPQMEWYWKYAKTLVDMEEQDNQPDQLNVPILEKTYQAIKEESINQVDLEKQFVLAKIAFYLHEYKVALDRYKKINTLPQAKTDYWQSRIQVGMGQAALREGKTEVALAVLKEADARINDDILCKKLLAEAYCQAGLPTDAEAIAAEVPEILPARSTNSLWYARFMERLGKIEESVKAYREAAELDPGDFLVKLEWADSERKAGDLEKSERILTDLLSSEPSDPQLWVSGSRIADQLSDQPLSITYLKNAIKAVNGKDLTLFIQLAVQQAKRKNFTEAIQSLSMAVSIISTQPEYLEIAAILQAEAGDYGQAIESLKQSFDVVNSQKDLHSAISLPQSWSEMISSEGTKWHTLFQWAKKNGKMQDALAYIENAVSLAPENFNFRKEAAYLANQLVNDAQLKMHLSLPLSMDHLEYSISEKEDLAALYALKAHEDLEENKISEAKQAVAISSSYSDSDPLCKIINVRIGIIEGNSNLVIPGIGNLDPDNFAYSGLLIDACRITDAMDVADKYLTSHADDPLAKMVFAKTYIRASEEQQLQAALELSWEKVGDSLFTESLTKKAGSMLDDLRESAESEKIGNWNSRFELLSATDLNDISISLDRPDHCLSLALANWRLGKIEECAEICKTFPRDASLNVLRSMALRRIDTDAAMKAAQWAIENAPENVYSHIAFARTSESAGDQKTALQAYEKAIELRSDLSGLHQVAAEAGLHVGNSASVIYHLTEAVKADPGNEKLVLGLGKEYLKDNQVENAIAVLKNYSKNEVSISAEILLAKAYLAGGNHQAAIEQAEKVGSMANGTAEPLVESGQILLECGELQKAFDFARQAALISPESPVIILLIARIIAEKNSKQQALQLLQKAIEKGQQDYELLKARALYTCEIEGEDSAMPLLQEVYEIDHEDSQVLAALSEIHYHHAENAKAKEFGLAALNAGKSNEKLDQILGSIYHAEGNLDKAVFHLTKAIEIQRSTPEPYLELSEVYKTRRDYKLATETLLKAIEHISSNIDIYLSLAGLLKDGKDYQNAELMLRKAMELAPDDLGIRRQLGAVIALNLIHSSPEVHYAYEH